MPELRDTIKNTNSVVFSLTLNKAGELPTSRTLTIDYINLPDPPAKMKYEVGIFRNLLLGKFNKFLQPNGWRDSDIEEDVWTITEVKAKIIAKTESDLDFS